ncbi:unnamed protein product, partial [Rotaria magnacalcarata]
SNLWDVAKNNIKRTPRPTVRAQLENFIEEIKHYHSYLDIQTIFSIVFHCFFVFIPTIVVYKLYDGPGMKQSFISFLFGLYMILVVGCQLAYNAADNRCTKCGKFLLYSIWLLINISVLIFYYYIHLPTSIFTIHLHREIPLMATVIDLMWPIAMMIVEYFSRQKSKTTKYDNDIKLN